MSERRIPAKQATRGRTYLTVTGLYVQSWGVDDSGMVLLTLMDFPEDSPVISVMPTYPLVVPEVDTALTVDEHRVNSRIGFVLKTIRDAGDIGVLMSELVNLTVSEGHLEGSLSVEEQEQMLWITISNLRQRGHQIVRLANTYYYRGRKNPDGE